MPGFGRAFALAGTIQSEEPRPDMNDDQLLRYGRHIMLDGLDYEGQERLLGARVLIVGLGGLGSPVALYLAASGVGELHLADFDDGDIKGSTAQIIYRKFLLTAFLVHTIGQCRSGGFINDALDREASYAKPFT